MRTIQGIAVGLCCVALAGTAVAQPAVREGAPPASASARTERFDPEAATEAYLARLSPQQRARWC